MFTNSVNFQATSLNAKLSNHKDNIYLKALIENNDQLIEQIYQKCSEDVKRMIISNHGTSEDAKDIFQDVLIALYGQVNRGFRLSCSIESFMLMACKRKWLSRLTKQKVHKKYEQSICKSQLEKTIYQLNSEDSVLSERMALLEKNIDLLGPSCKQILRFSFSRNKEGQYHSLKEISAYLGLSYSYVRKKASESKHRLSQLINSDPLASGLT